MMAVGDESMRQRLDGTGIYVMAAPVFARSDAPELRAAAAELARGKLPFHWHEAGPKIRARAVDMLTRLDALHFVVVGAGLDNARQERGRRLVLQRLLWELERVDVDEIWLDARRPRQDKDDSAAIAAWRARKILAPKPRVAFVHAEHEPLLWLADIVAGAVSAAHGHGENQYVRPLGGILEVVRMELA